MLIINQALLLTDLDALDREIQVRLELLDQLVGSLYPGIVSDEIEKLQTLKRTLEREKFPSTGS